jgi:hypothetical protein
MIQFLLPRPKYFPILPSVEPEWLCGVMLEAPNPHRLHPTFILYIQSILTSYHDVDGHMGEPLTLLCLCRWEWISRRSLSDVVISWLRLQTCTDYIPHPCHMYTKCFSTLICCVWAYGCTLTLLHLCRSGVDFRKIELSPSPSDVVMSWLRLQTRLEWIPHPCHMYT